MPSSGQRPFLFSIALVSLFHFSSGARGPCADVPADVEKSGAALLASSRQAQGADSTKESNAMNRPTTSTAIPTRALKFEALANISASFELFCLASGIEALGEMMDHDARAIWRGAGYVLGKVPRSLVAALSVISRGSSSSDPASHGAPLKRGWQPWKTRSARSHVGLQMPEYVATSTPTNTHKKSPKASFAYQGS